LDHFYFYLNTEAAEEHSGELNSVSGELIDDLQVSAQFGILPGALSHRTE
jgi:hypothetical protein